MDVIKTNQRIVLQELTHAMFFHPELYLFYHNQFMNRYEEGTQLRTTPVDETTLPQLDSFFGYTYNYYYLTRNLTKLAQAVAEHFNCSGA